MIHLIARKTWTTSPPAWNTVYVNPAAISHFYSYKHLGGARAYTLLYLNTRECLEVDMTPEELSKRLPSVDLNISREE